MYGQYGKNLTIKIPINPNIKLLKLGFKYRLIFNNGYNKSKCNNITVINNIDTLIMLKQYQLFLLTLYK
jgi:hypothetical protein